MQKLLVILLLLPFLGLGQQVDNIDLTNVPIEEINDIPFREIGPQPQYLEIDLPINSSAPPNMSTPYPIIFLHGLNGDFFSWWNFYGGSNNIPANPSATGLNDWGWSYGGHLQFCLNTTGNISSTNVQYICDINNDITPISFNLSSADYYIMNFDCDINTCGTTNTYTNPRLSNQAAIILQARALGEAINDVLLQTGKEKVILVGHSMGGLAAREYLQNNTHWQGYSHHRVAKLMTTGTPHGGSNSSDLLGVASLFTNSVLPDVKSDAIRDLRRSYSSTSDLGVILGYPPMTESTTNITNTYYNYDVDCDNSIGDNIYGISNASAYASGGVRPFPLDLEYSCIMGNHGIILASDGVVYRDRADISNYSPLTNSSLNFEKWEIDIDFTNDGQGHKDLVNYDYINFRALDEPDNSAYAYKLDFGTTYMGHLTCQGDNFSNFCYDYDYYKFTLNQPTTISIAANDLPANTNSVVVLYDINQIPLAVEVASSGSAIYTNYLNAGTYYVRISGDAYVTDLGNNTPWGNPYSYSVNAFGCTDPLANNYNPQANIDDASCCYTALSGSTSTLVSCFGGNNGSANIILNGGTPPYSYLWSDVNGSIGQISASATNLTAGSYNCLITDANGCAYQVNNLIVNQPLQALFVAISQSNSNLLASPSGGTPNYSYLWNGPLGFISTSQNITPQTNGQYTVTITDDFGCTYISPGYNVSWITTDLTDFHIVDLSIYPNPTDQIVNINFSTIVKQNIKIRLISTIGEIVFIENLQNYSGKYSKKINLDGYSKGTYFLEIETYKGITNYKIILN